jgi:uncharacterized membrane-anchored protein
MKMSKLLFAVVVVAQLAAPAWMIVGHELTLRQGVLFKFKTAPVDPYDAFRGRYVALRFEQNTAPLAPGGKLERGQKVYATLATDKDGFAKFSAVSATPPTDKLYLCVHVSWLNGSNVNLELPFDRYYLGEDLAPAAEQAYWQNNRRGQTNHNAYASVRIRNGSGVIENLFVAGKPIVELAREQPAENQ